jgi:drug/metabolite transporter (DMT)-like permease
MAGCLWGTGFYFGKIALSEMPVAAMVLFRFVFACAGLLPVMFFDRRHFAGTEWGWVLAASLLGVPVLYLLVFKGLSLTTVSHASLMVGTLAMLLAGADGSSDLFSLQSSRDVKRPAAVVTKAGTRALQA